ncbi:MAG: hypothetical protein JXM70_20065 [Pirellulales bacterium]|nr:hypothetical protein [Pirellulales bacterium]
MSKTLTRLSTICSLVLVSISFIAPSQGQESESIDDTLVKFQGLDKSYAPAPLWTWNDLMTEEAIRRQLHELKEQGVQQVFVHPRPGLMTTYLTDDWFKAWRCALETAEKLDMNIWIYDENSYPSGFAGGFVSVAMPEARKQTLSFGRTKDRPEVNDDVLAVYIIDKDNQPHLVTDKVKKKETPQKADYLVARRYWCPKRDWFAGKYYVDIIRPGVTKKFLDITLGAYKKHFGDQFGKRIPGCFTDEPSVSHTGYLHWNEELPEMFKKKWGYPLIENLSKLVHKSGDWRQVRYHYQYLINELFVNNWCRTYADYCESLGLEMTGHYFEHVWPQTRCSPDQMAAMIWEHRPGIDMLDYGYKFYDPESPNAQFGNVRSVKELSSVTNQAGRKRNICESFGASGWWLHFSDYKCYTDWLIALGVNTIDEHYTPITIRGARKYDHPPFFSYHEPWWKDYHVLARYNTRLCAAMSSGKQVNHVVVLEPTTTMWMHQQLTHRPEELLAYAQPYQDMVKKLELSQAECDLLSECVLQHFGREGKPGKLTIGQREYDLFIIPPNTENLNSDTVTMLETYLAGGGKVLCCSDVLNLVDGKLSKNKIQKLTASPNWRQASPDEAIQAAVDRTASSGLVIKRAKDDAGQLYHQRRRLDDGELVFMVNTSTKHPTAATMTADARSVQAWDAFSGTVHAYPATSDGKTLTAQIEIPPCGSLLLALSNKEKPGKTTTVAGPMVPMPGSGFANSKQLSTVGPLTAKRLGPNVLTFDFVDVTAGGETKKGMAVVDAQDWVFKKHGYEKNPWRHAVQWRDEQMKHKYSPDSGFTATYHFTIEDKKVPTPIEIVIERADLYEITCNGKPVTPTPKRWWLDRSFGVVDLSKTAHIGPNEVTIAMKPMTPYGEVANTYLIGDFALEPAEKVFVVKAPGSIAVPTARSDAKEAKTRLSWKAQGLPFYAEGIAYEQTFDVPADGKSDSKKRFFVELPSWRGSLARISVNGKPAGHIIIDPWRCDVTSLIQPGKNLVRVEIVGTLANTLGPHHNKKFSHWCGPFNFGGCPNGPPAGKEYNLYDYGLWKPLQLKAVW